MPYWNLQVVDLRHYDRKKGPGYNDQPPTVYGEASCAVLKGLMNQLGRGAFGVERVLCSPQPRAWRAAELVLPGTAVEQMSWLDDFGSDPRGGGLVQMLKGWAKTHGVSVEQAALMGPDEVREYMFGRATSACWEIVGQLADCDKSRLGRLTMFSHGAQVEARAMLFSALQAGLIRDIDEFDTRKHMSFDLIGGAMVDTCEGFVYGLQMETSSGTLDKVTSVTRVELPAAIKACKDALTRLPVPHGAFLTDPPDESVADGGPCGGGCM